MLGTSQVKFNTLREYAIGLVVPRLDRIDRLRVCYRQCLFFKITIFIYHSSTLPLVTFDICRNLEFSIFVKRFFEFEEKILAKKKKQ